MNLVSSYFFVDVISSHKIQSNPVLWGNISGFLGKEANSFLESPIWKSELLAELGFNFLN
jgi:hypothetical protein